MIKKLGIASKNELLKNKKILKLSWFSTWGHSISNFFLLAWNLNNLLAYKYNSGVSILLVFSYFWDTIKANHMILGTILIVIFILFGYFVLFPIANAGVLHMISHKGKIGTSLGKGLDSFFLFFEYNALKTSLSFFTYIITLARLFTLDIINNYFVIGLLIVWGGMVLISAFLWPFTKIYIAIEGDSVYIAIKKSVQLALSNFALVYKAVIYQTILTIYFYLKTGLLFLLPTIIMYVFIYFNFFKNSFITSLLRFFGILGVMILSYISSIIYAYFEIYWYKLYKHITKE